MSRLSTPILLEVRPLLTIAFRNISKHRRRSLSTVLAIGLAFAAINVFGGFAHYIVTGLTDGYVHALGRGHITIARRGFLALRRTKIHGPLISLQDQETIRRISEGIPDITMASPELHVSGALAFGGRARGVYAIGRVASEASFIRSQAGGMVGRLRLFEARTLGDGRPAATAVSHGVARLLELAIGASAELRAERADGQHDRRNVEISGFFSVPLLRQDSYFMLISLDLAQRLLGTRGVDRFTVLVRRGTDVSAVGRSLQEALDSRRLDLEVLTLRDLDQSTTRATRMLGIIFRVMAVIMLAIATTTVVNTTSMAMLERTREVGTMRALGLTVRGAVQLFGIESGLLAVFGCAFGVGVSGLSWLAFRLFEPTWVPPYFDVPVPLGIDLVPTYAVGSTVLVVVLAVLGTIVPARRVALRSVAATLGSI